MKFSKFYGQCTANALLHFLRNAATEVPVFPLVDCC